MLRLEMILEDLKNDNYLNKDEIEKQKKE